ncbi:MAG: ferritin-like domain-containing protein [Deltaproteobacteria bacterium]|nr:ferritin-like domain-containing protein [Deltaproteobacteria bacterium]
MIDDLAARLPLPVSRWYDRFRRFSEPLGATDNRRVMVGMLPAAVRGLLLQRGKQGTPVRFPASHDAWFDFGYPRDEPEMADLYERAKDGQWDGGRDLAWGTSVDPRDPDVPILPAGFLDFSVLRRAGVTLDAEGERALIHDIAAWLLSQFLHGEQGALMAACQVTEAVERFDGKLYGATQVVDEARHIEVFHRYLSSKLGKLYQINDNLFVVIDALMTDARWDMKFLGMQIMVEGLALGAFGSIFQLTREPLLKELLRRVILDEARHVHYGVVALRSHVRGQLNEAEVREREDWAFEMAVLMRNRFLAREVWEERYEGRVPWSVWAGFIQDSVGMEHFRRQMFRRLVPNLREIGLLGPRIRPYYEKEGMGAWFEGEAAPTLSPEDMLAA